MHYRGAVKRITLSIALLVIVFFMSGFFVGEPANFVRRPDQVFTPQSLNYTLVSSTECLCDFGASSPTLGLLALAAVAASVVMAVFIYGSYFIAILVTG